MGIPSAENFLSGLRVVFDRERLVLGWKKFDCKLWFHWHFVEHIDSEANLSDMGIVMTQATLWTTPPLCPRPPRPHQMQLLLCRAATLRRWQRQTQMRLRCRRGVLRRAIHRIPRPCQISPRWCCWCSLWLSSGDHSPSDCYKLRKLYQPHRNTHEEIDGYRFFLIFIMFLFFRIILCLYCNRYCRERLSWIIS